MRTLIGFMVSNPDQPVLKHRWPQNVTESTNIFGRAKWWHRSAMLRASVVTSHVNSVISEITAIPQILREKWRFGPATRQGENKTIKPTRSELSILRQICNV